MASKQTQKLKVEVNSKLKDDDYSEYSSSEDFSDDSSYSDYEYDEEDEDFLKACCLLDDRLLLHFQHLYKKTSERRAIAEKNANELLAEEEREKKKAEKRKARKKKRKEKKKEGKEHMSNLKSDNSEKQDFEKKNTQRSFSGSNATSSCSEDDGEELLDVNSAFVSIAVNKKKKNVTTDKTRPNKNKTEVSADQIVAESERLAVIGYKLASKEQYEQAVEFFTKAIHLAYDDDRFFSNRSFCHCQLGIYSKALKDADKAINLAPVNPKGYYRRAEALKGLGQFKEAQEAYERVVELDEECEDAFQELKFVKLQQLLKMGFPEKQATAALEQHETLQDVISALSVPPAENYFSTNQKDSFTELYFSDEESLDSISSQHFQESGENSNKLFFKANKNLTDTKEHLSLWVGNISRKVTERHLIDLFSRFGIVSSVRLLPEKYCAFVNFQDKNSAGPAMKCLQNKEVGGEKLLIRYPKNSVPESHQQIVVKKAIKVPVAGSVATKVTGPVKGDECHFWRTTGCVFGIRCRYKHVKESKGIDRKPWQKSS